MKTKISDASLREMAAKMTISEIAEQVGCHYDTIRHRLKKLGLSGTVKAIEVTPESVREDVAKIVAKEKESNAVKKNKVLAQMLLAAEKERDALLSVGGVETYSIKSTGKESEKSQATAIVLASDWHYEENVKASQVNGLNKYDTVIAKERAEKFFRVTAKLIKVHQKEYSISNLVLALLGDFISGSIHDDLKEGNNIQPTQAIWEVQNIISSGIEYLLKETDVNLIIPCSSGNHARITDKLRASTAYGNSLEFLIYREMEKYFHKESRVKFIINDAYLTYMNIYKYRVRFHHGDSIKYGGGIGGIFIPVFKAISQWNKQKNTPISGYADWDFFGHFHQLKDGGNFVTNGSLIGYNSYAIRIKADYEEPKQAFMIIDEERGLDVVRKITL